MNKQKSLMWLVVALSTMFGVSCGGNTNTSNSAATPTSGTLGVYMTDAPACGFDAVYVTVNKVRVHQSSSAADSDSGWTDVTLSPPRKINLLSLNNGVLATLGQTSLAPGHYTQLRLVLDPNIAGGLANSVIPTGGEETALKTPSAVQSGIKLVHGFDVAAGQRVDLVLDFDACKSIVTRGNGTYGLKPVIKVIPYMLNGINGFVDSAILGSNAMITAQQNGVVIQSTAPNALTGEFFLSRLAPGNYDVVFTANGHTTTVITAVPVATNSSIVVFNNSGTPINLPVSATRLISGTETLNPASSTEVAYATAKQTLGTTPIITVKSVAADDTASGAYTLVLPIDAPLLGQYSSSVPITYVAQSGVAGKYTLEASAIGYQTQSVNTDISAMDATQNFILVP